MNAVSPEGLLIFKCIQIWHKRLGLNVEPIRIWCENVKVTVTSQNPFGGITQEDIRISWGGLGGTYVGVIFKSIHGYLQVQLSVRTTWSALYMPGMYTNPYMMTQRCRLNMYDFMRVVCVDTHTHPYMTLHRKKARRNAASINTGSTAGPSQKRRVSRRYWRGSPTVTRPRCEGGGGGAASRGARGRNGTPLGCIALTVLVY